MLLGYDSPCNPFSCSVRHGRATGCCCDGGGRTCGQPGPALRGPEVEVRCGTMRCVCQGRRCRARGVALLARKPDGEMFTCSGVVSCVPCPRQHPPTTTSSPDRTAPRPKAARPRPIPCPARDTQLRVVRRRVKLWRRRVIARRTNLHCRLARHVHGRWQRPNDAKTDTFLKVSCRTMPLCTSGPRGVGPARACFGVSVTLPFSRGRRAGANENFPGARV